MIDPLSTACAELTGEWVQKQTFARRQQIPSCSAPAKGRFWSAAPDAHL